jgi:stage II sporulation protein D
MLTLIPLTAFFFVDNSKGKFRVYDIDRDKLLTLSPREYVIGALASEMPPSFHKEALKAQAVAIYTNAIRSVYSESEYIAKVSPKRLHGYTNEKILKERWGKNFEFYSEKMSAAVDEVLGTVIVYKDKPILAAYHSMSGGKTESAENVWGQSVSYLTPVESEGDKLAADLVKSREFSSKEAREILKFALPETFLPEVDTLLFTDLEYSDSGTLLSAVVGDKKISGQKIRKIFSLRSAFIEISAQDGKVIFTTKGYGHAVGLSQYGADFLGRQGSDFKEILKHYYKGTSLLYSM